MTVLRLLSATLLLLTLGSAPALSERARKPVTHTVTIDATRFEPEVLTIKAGDSVIWVNKDVIPHTATSQAGGFDSGTIATGASWKHGFRQKGAFEYLCAFHPTMKGKLKVE